MKSLLTAFWLLCSATMAANAEKTPKGIDAPGQTYSEGEADFEARCALCHQLPDPRQFKPAQWRKVLAVMQSRLEQKGMMPLSEDEMIAIGDFLDQNGRR